MHDEISENRQVRILIADPHPVFRLGLVALLSTSHPDWDVAEADSLDDHRTQLIGRVFDILILECNLLGVEFEQDTRFRSRLNLNAAVIAVTQRDDALGALGCLAAGAHATISRTGSTLRTLATIETIAFQRNEPPLAASHQHPAGGTYGDAAEVRELTPRQLDVLRLLAMGQSNKVIARDLGLSVSTVKVHLNTVFRALGARNRVEAVIRARPFQASTIRHEN